MKNGLAWTAGILLGSVILGACGGATDTDRSGASGASPQAPGGATGSAAAPGSGGGGAQTVGRGGGGAGQCVWEGKVYQVGDPMPSFDGCNSCSCEPYGRRCTSSICPSGGFYGLLPGVGGSPIVAVATGGNAAGSPATGGAAGSAGAPTTGGFGGGPGTGASGGQPAVGGSAGGAARGGAPPQGGAGAGGGAARGGAPPQGGAGGVPGLPEDGCVVAYRLDDCCVNPLATTVEAVRADACLWPYGAWVTEAARDSCPWPEMCATVDCAFFPLPSRIAALDEAGQCQFAGECATEADCVYAIDYRVCCACPTVFPRAQVQADPCIRADGDGAPPPELACADCSSVACAGCPELVLRDPECVVNDSQLNACQ